MDAVLWHKFFVTAVRVLGGGDWSAERSKSWCAWTTFTRLREDCGYWTGGLPEMDEVLDTHMADGGVWGQPFSFSELAHVIVPCEFYWESVGGPGFTQGKKAQNIQELSEALHAAGVPHRLTDLVLEIKCY
jgi:hypothetical protein